MPQLALLFNSLTIITLNLVPLRIFRFGNMINTTILVNLINEIDFHFDNNKVQKLQFFTITCI